MSDEASITNVQEEVAEKREIDKYFLAAHRNNASDLHLKVGEPPLFRVKGSVVRARIPAITDER